VHGSDNFLQVDYGGVMITEKIRVIEIRKCGECPYHRICDVVLEGIKENEIHPDCPLPEKEVINQALVDRQAAVGRMFPAGTAYEQNIMETIYNIDNEFVIKDHETYLEISVYNQSEGTSLFFELPYDETKKLRDVLSEWLELRPI